MLQYFCIVLPCFGSACGSRLAKAHSMPPAAAVKDEIFKFPVFIIRHYDKVTAAQHTGAKIVANDIFFFQGYRAFGPFYQYFAYIAGTTALLWYNGRNGTDIFL